MRHFSFSAKCHFQNVTCVTRDIKKIIQLSVFHDHSATIPYSFGNRTRVIGFNQLKLVVGVRQKKIDVRFDAFAGQAIRLRNGFSF